MSKTGEVKALDEVSGVSSVSVGSGGQYLGPIGSEGEIWRVTYIASLDEAGRTVVGGVVFSEACAGFFFEDSFFKPSLVRLVPPLEAAFPLVFAAGAFFFPFSWLAVDVVGSAISASQSSVSKSPFVVCSGVGGMATCSSPATLAASAAALPFFAAPLLPIFGFDGIWSGRRGMAVCETRS